MDSGFDVPDGIPFLTGRPKGTGITESQNITIPILPYSCHLSISHDLNSFLDIVSHVVYYLTNSSSHCAKKYLLEDFQFVTFYFTVSSLASQDPLRFFGKDYGLSENSVI